jgi:hypothetical protein
MRVKPFEFATSITVRLGWKDVHHSSPEALVDTTFDYASICDEDEIRKAKEILLRTGHVDTKDMEEGGDPMQIKQYVQRPNAVYSKYCALQDNGWGAAIIFEDSITVEKAVMLVRKMLWSLTDAEAMGLERELSEASDDDSGFFVDNDDEADDDEADDDEADG